ncbi:AAA family ATPase [Aliarcobacter cryaerophilus]|uniref:AbiJ-related protein n=1 Tax=Aliarcobacter cryaerophilus TaxID=28198 RepID=UPI003AF3F975
MNIKISKKIKLEIYNTLKEEKLISDEEKWMDFLNSIWDLRAMPSTDDRYTNAYDDIIQHTVNNDDWKLDELFLEILKLLEDDKKFIKFIETIVYPEFRKNEDEIINFVLLINSYLEKDKFSLIVSSYDQNDLPIYTVNVKLNDNSYSDLPKNEIVFNLVREAQGSYFRFNSHTPPTTMPSFVLVNQRGWDDSGWRTNFGLFYYESEINKTYIGSVKITDSVNYNLDNFPTTFTLLEDNFFSLGQEEDYYLNLKKIFGRNFESILYSLRDAAFFPEIQEKFENEDSFKQSLIRYDSSEQLLREIKYKIYGFDLSNLYSFKYTFKPKYSSETIEVAFDFNSKEELPSRIFAIIGKNGTGKTQLLTSLPLNIAKKEDNFFSPRTPLFSKVIAISYSLFDNFEIPKKTSKFNYIYCGLRDENKDLLTPMKQLLRFHKTNAKIFTLKRVEEWRNILSNFIDEEIINEFIVETTNSSNKKEYTYQREKFNLVKNKLSSGQHILLYTISEIVSNIRRDSLLLFDEPETHLHPNAISQLMNIIYELAHKFESYCIITTHSPLIIQELLSKNVFILEKDENIPYIKKIGIESFGENLTTLTEEVFGNKEISKQYKKIIKRLIDNGNKYEEVVSKLESDGIPLNLNVRLYIKSKTI